MSTTFTVAILTAGVVILAGCGDSEETAATSAATTTSSGPASAAQAPTTPAAPPFTDTITPVGPTWLKTDEVAGLGTIVLDSSGRTLDASSTDTATESTCYDACTDTWHPLLTLGDPAGGIGIDVAKEGTITRRDGSSQVTYNGHPLYHYAGDTTPGQTNGQNVELFGAEWSVLTADGERVH